MKRAASLLRLRGDCGRAADWSTGQAGQFVIWDEKLRAGRGHVRAPDPAVPFDQAAL
ncbi:hypothetical protein J2X53_002314 [Pseudorhodobacter sp. 4114]|nr:hypothetical protein [Pseudorhodobacter sp. 4114]